MSSLLDNHSFHMYNRPAAWRANLIVVMEFIIDSCGTRTSHLQRVLNTRVEEELACQHNEDNKNNIKLRRRCKTPVSLSATYRGRFGSLFPVFASERHDHVSGHRQQASVIGSITRMFGSPLYFEVCGQRCLWTRWRVKIPSPCVGIMSLPKLYIYILAVISSLLTVNIIDFLLQIS